MKGLVLCGGKGTRLRPLTHTGAKQLIPVANRPILYYVLDNLKEAGIKEVGVIISPDTGEEIRDAVRAWDRADGISFRFILQETPSGLAHAVMVAQDFLGNDPFVMYLGDNLIGTGIADLVEKFRSKRPDGMILLKEVENPSAFGVAELSSNGEVTRLVEKPQVPPSNLALVGVYIFSPAILQAVSRIKPSARGELEITDAIQWLIEKGSRVMSQVLGRWWLDTGKKDDLLKANTIVLDDLAREEIAGEVDAASRVEGRVELAESARVAGSTVRGPTVIGEGCVVENSFIGPYTSLGEGVVVKDSVVEHSVVLAGSKIIGVDRLEDSLIGRNAQVISHSSHRSYRMSIGDDSVVEL